MDAALKELSMKAQHSGILSDLGADGKGADCRPARLFAVQNFRGGTIAISVAYAVFFSNL
jgi:hypothetical protein